MANIPHTPVPEDDAENVSIDLIKLEWDAGEYEIPNGYEAGDFDGPIRYDVRFYSTIQYIPYDWLGYTEDTFLVLADAIAGPVILDDETAYQWKIDVELHTWWDDWVSISQSSDTWTFTTESVRFSPPAVSYDLISGGSGSGPYDDPPGVEGTDFRYNGENNMITVKRLVAAANNTIWFEDA